MCPQYGVNKMALDKWSSQKPVTPAESSEKYQASPN